MPDSVKISDLTPRAAVSTDVLPAVDATFNSTVRVSASSIAAIGGGPPGDGTVTTAKIGTNQVTLAKIATIGAYKLIGNPTSSSATPSEVSATVFGLALLNAGDGTTARALINDSNVFTGQCTFADGTAAAPSIANTGNVNTGIYWPDNNTVGITTEGTLKFYVDGEGTQYSNIAEQLSVIRPQYSCRAWVAFNGSTSTTTTISSQATIAQRYGLTSSLYFDGWTDTSGTQTAGTATGLTTARVVYLEGQFGNDITYMQTQAADGRSNYTTPADNYHWRYTGSAWSKLSPATGHSWIGQIRFKPSASAALGILSQGGVTSVTNTGTGTYQINFKDTMPDANYAVVTGSKRASFASAGGDDVLTRTTTSVTIKHYETTSATNTSYLAVSIFR